MKKKSIEESIKSVMLGEKMMTLSKYNRSVDGTDNTPESYLIPKSAYNIFLKELVDATFLFGKGDRNITVFLEKIRSIVEVVIFPVLGVNKTWQEDAWKHPEKLTYIGKETMGIYEDINISDPNEITELGDLLRSAVTETEFAMAAASAGDMEKALELAHNANHSADNAHSIIRSAMDSKSKEKELKKGYAESDVLDALRDLDKKPSEDQIDNIYIFGRYLGLRTGEINLLKYYSLGEDNLNEDVNFEKLRDIILGVLTRAEISVDSAEHALDTSRNNYDTVEKLHDSAGRVESTVEDSDRTLESVKKVLDVVDTEQARIAELAKRIAR